MIMDEVKVFELVTIWGLNPTLTKCPISYSYVMITL
jgi:hypothetical protein